MEKRKEDKVSGMCSPSNRYTYWYARLTLQW